MRALIDTGAPEELERAREAAEIAAATRDALLHKGMPFIAETVFSHPSKLDLIDQAIAVGYFVKVYVIAIPVALAVQRVRYRVADGGHDVPAYKIVERCERLWPLVADAVRRADRTEIWDNSRQHRTDKVAEFIGGLALSPPQWPGWTPEALRELG